jgi:hypothetical protein
MAGIVSRTGLLGAASAPIPQLAVLVSRANDALLHQRWDAPRGDNVRDITQDGLSRWPNEPQLLRIRTLACSDIVRAARTRRDEGNMGDALRLAKLAYQLDPSDDTAQKLAAEMESQAQAPPPGAVPPLASVRALAAPAAPSVAARATLDASDSKPSVGQPVDFSARIVSVPGGAHGKIDGASFHVAGPGVAPGMQLEAVDEGSGVFRTTFTFSQAGRFEVTFGARTEGAPVRAVRALQVVAAGGPKAAAPLPPESGEALPAPSPSAKWL